MSVHSLLLLEVFRIVLTCVTSDEDSFNSRSLTDMREFLFLLLSWGGVLNF